MLYYIILCVATFVAIFVKIRRRNAFPNIKGPAGTLVVGNALQMQDRVPYFLSKWAKEYGDVMKLNIFGRDVVVANSHKAIAEVLITKTEMYGGRPECYRTNLLFKGEDIGLSSLSPKWKVMKCAAMVGLKQTSNHLKQLEDLIMERTGIFLQTLSSYEGDVVDVFDDITSLIYHITFIMIFGHGISDSDHKEYQALDQSLMDFISPNADYAALDIIPVLRGPWYAPWRKTRAAVKRVNAFFQRHISTTMAAYAENEISCILDGLIQKHKQTLIDNNIKITMDNITAIVIDLTTAGNSSTTYTLYYFVMLMATQPDIQSEAHAEVIKVIGQRLPTLKDKGSIPYVESLLFEILRLMSMAFLGFPHRAMRDTTLLEHAIPAGTEVWTNLWHLHHDERLWTDPWMFKPKRFLDNDGKLVLPDHPLRRQLFPFGAGRRVCAGEILARNRLFLLVTTLLQRFKFSTPEGAVINTDPRTFSSDIGVRPGRFSVKLNTWNI